MGRTFPNIPIRDPHPEILPNMVLKYHKIEIHIFEYGKPGNTIFDILHNGIFDYG